MNTDQKAIFKQLRLESTDVQLKKKLSTPSEAKDLFQRCRQIEPVKDKLSKDELRVFNKVFKWSKVLHYSHDMLDENVKLSIETADEFKSFRIAVDSCRTLQNIEPVPTIIEQLNRIDEFHEQLEDAFDAVPQDRGKIKALIEDLEKDLKIDYSCELQVIRKQIKSSEDWDQKVQKQILGVKIEDLCSEKNVSIVREYLKEILDDDEKAESGEQDSLLCLVTQKIYDELRCTLVKLMVWQATQIQ